jgi:hypothetical protein
MMWFSTLVVPGADHVFGSHLSSNNTSSRIDESLLNSFVVAISFILVAQASNSGSRKTGDKWNKVRKESELLIDCQSDSLCVSGRMLHLLVRLT